jgi:hypothetical protein
MWKPLLGIIALSCTVLFAPFSAAAQSSNVPESLCAPVSDLEIEPDSSISALDYSQNLNTQIDLLENGINPGFTSVPEIDKAELMKSVAQFQAAKGLPVTGRLDEQTLAKLNITTPKVDQGSSPAERAKPSR